MFDLNLAHIHRAERERDVVADLRVREILKASAGWAATEPTSDLSPRAASPRTAPRVRALGR